MVSFLMTSLLSTGSSIPGSSLTGIALVNYKYSTEPLEVVYFYIAAIRLDCMCDVKKGLSDGGRVQGSGEGSSEAENIPLPSM